MNNMSMTLRRKFFAGLQSEKGVSLLELMIVVVIIGLMASMAGPRFSREMSKIEFRGTARSAVSAMRQARSLAISDKADYGVDFNSNSGTVTLFKDVVSSDPPALTSGDSIIRVDTLSGDNPVVSSSLTGPLLYSPNGSASESASILLLSYSTRDNDYSTKYAILDVLASTGRSKLSEIHFY